MIFGSLLFILGDLLIMKRFFNLLFILFICSLLFSQSMNDGENKIGEIRSFDSKDLMVVETKNFENVIKNVPESKLSLSYYPIYNEVRIVLSCPYSKYDEGETIIAIRNIMIDFIEEKGFYHFSGLNEDVIKYKKDENHIVWINYFAHIKIFK